jgi:hypothetical protein
MHETIKEIYLAALVYDYRLELHQVINGALEVEIIMNYEELSCHYRLPQEPGELAYELWS